MALAIAQLVERWTVEVLKSIGHWFDSGSRDFFGMSELFLTPQHPGFHIIRVDGRQGKPA